MLTVSNRRFILIAVVCFVLMVGGSLYYLQTQPPKEPIIIYKATEVETKPKPPPPGETFETGHWHGDEWHTGSHDAHAPAAAATPSAQGALVGAQIAEADFINPTSRSSNPLFADGVPEHLQCPPEFIGVYLRELEDREVLRPKIMPIYEEIIEQWNPNRPISEMWAPNIAFDIWCRDNADPEKGEMFSGQGRIDWLIQSWLDFPEMMVLSAEDSERFRHMVQVAMGNWSPDFNKFTLPDGSGRTFRTADDKKYIFTWWPQPRTQILEDGSTKTYTSPWTYTTGPSNADPNAEVIEIDLDTITDAELEAVQGWNYNINPYTTGLYKLGDKK